MEDLAKNRLANLFTYLWMVVYFISAFFKFGSDIRKDILFIGTAICLWMFFVLAKNYKANFIVKSFFGCVVINEVLFGGEFDFIEIPILAILIPSYYLHKRWKSQH